MSRKLRGVQVLAFLYAVPGCVGVTTPAPSVVDQGTPRVSAAAEPKLPAEPEAETAASVCSQGMALVQGGEFAEAQFARYSSDKFLPPLVRALDDYCLDLHEVTVEEFAQCVRDSKCAKSDISEWFEQECVESSDACRRPLNRIPVNNISFAMAESYCEAQGKRLPTFEEWVWAAVGGTEDRRFPWGDDDISATRANQCDRQCLIDSRCNEADSHFGDDFEGVEACVKETVGDLKDDGWPKLAPVGSFPLGAGRWGHMDMIGNVSEVATRIKNKRHMIMGNNAWTEGAMGPASDSYPFGTSKPADGFRDHNEFHLGIRCAARRGAMSDGPPGG